MTSEVRDPLVQKLGVCLALADILSGKSHCCTNEVYWHTREAAWNMLRKQYGEWFPDRPIAGIWANLLNVAQTSNYSVSYLKKHVSDDIWIQVAHPDLIIQDVLGS
jgi:hypothetical protein